MSDRLDGLSMNIEQTEREKLRAVFPQCFTEGKLDIDKLLTMCGEYITDDFEKYEFKWKGKSECLQLAQKRSAGTLRPCPEESVNFDTTKNLYVEGDNLEVLKLLQTIYYRKVKMIYIDPPYNTGNDFVYEDDFTDPLARYKEVTSQATKSNPETMGRFHTAWLNMMYPRLRLAANLLTDDGVCFISIDDNEQHNLRKLCDEVFGEENFVAAISNINNPKGRSDDKFVATAHEHIVVYAKSAQTLDWYGFEPTEEITKRYNKTDSTGKQYREIDLRKTGENDLREDRPNLFYYFHYNEASGAFYPSRNSNPPDGFIAIFPQREDGKEGNWRWGLDTAEKQIDSLAAKFMPARKVWGVMQKDYLADRDFVKPTSAWTFKDVNSERGSEQFIELGFDKRIFPKPKPVGTIKRMIKLSTVADDVILDFFSGSATTAHAVMQLNSEDGGNRRFIMVQLPEVCDEKSEAFKAGYKNICEIGKERIRRAGAKVKESNPLGTESIDTGFRVFKLDTSNLKIWDNTPISGENRLSELERRLRGMLDVIKDDRSNLDVVYEVMLKLGQDLCEDITELDINGKTVYGVGADITFIVCLAAHITPEDAEAIAEYAPGRVIFTDQCFDDATDKSNVKLTMRNNSITMKML